MSTFNMEIAVEKLELLINQSETLLNTIALELEGKLKKDSKVQFSPSNLILSVQELGDDLQNLKAEAEVLIKDQEAVKHELDNEMQIICKKLPDMQERTGHSTNDANAACSIFKSRVQLHCG
ncbi:hypothetical protein X975_26023, partial [Stegodyphus mimosarum]